MGPRSRTSSPATSPLWGITAEGAEETAEEVDMTMASRRLLYEGGGKKGLEKFPRMTGMKAAASLLLRRPPLRPMGMAVVAAMRGGATASVGRRRRLTIGGVR